MALKYNAITIMVGILVLLVNMITTMNFKNDFIAAIILAGKSCGAGLATIGLTGAGVGVGLVFGALLVAYLEILWMKLDYLNSNVRLALTEAVGLLALMMAFLILFS